MTDVYEVRLSAAVGSTLAHSPYLTDRVRNLVVRLRDDPADVLTSETVIRLSDRVILGRDDPNLAFYLLRDRGLELGFYVDRLKKLISITSVTDLRHAYGD
jgi:hypothetical protein